MVAPFPNFYENITEARNRLQNTVVLYDNEPYYVLDICDHKPDGIFRVYLDKLGHQREMAYQNIAIPSYNYHATQSAERGAAMDKLADDPKSKYPIIRKMMNSPAFKRFRPFPLGMANTGGSAWYFERQPLRPAMQQGLAEGMIVGTIINTNPGKPRGGFSNHNSVSQSWSPTQDVIYDAIVGNNPTAQEALEALVDPFVENVSIAFDREFAFLRGPLGLIFLVYKTDIIGHLPKKDFTSVVLAPNYFYTREVVEELKLFHEVVVN